MMAGRIIKGCWKNQRILTGIVNGQEGLSRECWQEGSSSGVSRKDPEKMPGRVNKGC